MPAFGRRGQRPLAGRLRLVCGRRIAAQQLGHPLSIAQCRGDGDRIVGAPFQQMACHGVIVSLAQRMVPERDRHGTKAVHADPVIGGEAGCVDVSAMLQEQVHQIGAPRMHRVMQGAPPQVVADVRGGRLRRQPLLHQLDVARLDRVMDRVAGS